MISKQITREHIKTAITFIDNNGVPKKRQATKFNLHYKDKPYPPKYVLSIATKIATGRELEPSEFSGGVESNKFLMSRGFTIREGKEKLVASTQWSKPLKVCTVQVQIPSNNWREVANSDKFKLLESILPHLAKGTDILVLPAGFLNSGNRPPKEIFREIEPKVSKLILQSNSHLHIFLGIDGARKIVEGEARHFDQLGLAINRTGIVAVARKFHHPDDCIKLAKDAFSSEDNKSRSLKIKGKRVYLAVCYDIYGISRLKLKNELNCDLIVGMIHGFDRYGGDTDFARKGLTGAAKQWGVPTFASAVFADNRNPLKWPSGVQWQHGEESVNKFTYDDIRMEGESSVVPIRGVTTYLTQYEV